MQSIVNQNPARKDANAQPSISTKAPALDVSTVKRSLVTAVSNMSDNGQMAKIGPDGMKQLLLQCETITDYCYLIQVIKRYPNAVQAAEALVSDPQVFLGAANIIEQAMKRGNDISELVPLLVAAAMADHAPVMQAVADKVLGAYSPKYRFTEKPEDAAPFRPVNNPELGPDQVLDLFAAATDGSPSSASASRILSMYTGYYSVGDTRE
jgi:hypothetical protein